MMGRIGRLGRYLGRQGLMPNPRTGTVVQPDDLPRAIDEAKKGRVEYRLDREGLMHVTIGKATFDESENFESGEIISVVNGMPKIGTAKGTISFKKISIENEINESKKDVFSSADIGMRIG